MTNNQLCCCFATWPCVAVQAIPLPVSLLSGLKRNLVSQHKFRLHTNKLCDLLGFKHPTCHILPLPKVTEYLSFSMTSRLCCIKKSICREKKTHIAEVCIPTVKSKEYATSLHHKTDAYWCVSLFCCEVALKSCVRWSSETWQNMKYLVHYTLASLGAEQERQTPFSLLRHRGELEHPRLTLQTVPVECPTCKISYPPSFIRH